MRPKIFREKSAYEIQRAFKQSKDYVEGNSFSLRDKKNIWSDLLAISASATRLLIETFNALETKKRRQRNEIKILFTIKAQFS